MDRLTKRENLAGHDIAYVTDEDCFDMWSVPKKFAGDAIDRLAEIEDILGDEYDLDHLLELVEADREERCLVLPVKEGDKVWHINFYPFEDCPPEIFDAPFHITDYYQIGNSVFLSEEEAEAALEGENNG